MSQKAQPSFSGHMATSSYFRSAKTFFISNVILPHNPKNSNFSLDITSGIKDSLSGLADSFLATFPQVG